MYFVPERSLTSWLPLLGSLRASTVTSDSASILNRNISSTPMTVSLPLSVQNSCSALNLFLSTYCIRWHPFLLIKSVLSSYYWLSEKESWLSSSLSLKRYFASCRLFTRYNRSANPSLYQDLLGKRDSIPLQQFLHWITVLSATLAWKNHSINDGFVGLCLCWSSLYWLQF